MKTTIAIPARAGSTRFPNKPLAPLAGRTVLAHVVDAARAVADADEGVSVFVTTENREIADHARRDLGVPVILTPASCPSGSDRVMSALRQIDPWPDFVVNLQGDAPLTPPAVIRSLIDTFLANPRLSVVTPVQRLTWAQLDALRTAKADSASSGTTVAVNAQGRALWFSKGILPVMRDEATVRARGDGACPVLRHLGLYGFRPEVLERFCALPPSPYETLEGLEQLRLLEAGIPIQAVPVPEGVVVGHGGVDTPADLAAAEAILAGRA
jgi:3-deoxy-manno-octulosonate cytidylyltransferase (CMP-KDO synthetase)